jgi:magnesium chelatase family protein
MPTPPHFDHNVFSLINDGPYSQLVQVQLATFLQLPSFQLVGLPAAEISESRERVRSAIESSGFEFPRKRLVVNLAPAAIKKSGTGLDLAIALRILLESGSVTIPRNQKRLLVFGELSLDGSIRSAGNVARVIDLALRSGCDGILLSEEDRERTQELLHLKLKAANPLTPDIACTWISQLSELSSNAVDPENKKPAKAIVQQNSPARPDRPIRSVPHFARERHPPPHTWIQRALGIALSGNHHVLLLGPRGTGKTSALHWMNEQLPALNAEECFQRELLNELDVKPDRTGTRSNRERTIWVQRPSHASALTGSFARSKYHPGAISRAHHGILVADEFLEWNRDCRESLRGPLESSTLKLHYSEGAIELPVHFQFAATANLCPCGGTAAIEQEDKNQNKKGCRCSIRTIQTYQERLSGPILDRIDIRIFFNSDLESSDQQTRKCSSIKNWPSIIQSTQIELRRRYAGTLPGQMDTGRTELEIQKLNKESRLLLEKTNHPRSRHRIARLAMTICALDERKQVEPSMISEAQALRGDL